MFDPRSLTDAQLRIFDVDDCADLTTFDEHEPLLLERLRLTRADIELLRSVPITLDGCVVAGSDLSNVRMCGVKNSLIQDTKLRGTRVQGFVRNMVFERCQLSECSLRMATFEQVVFAQSTLTSCDFYGADLKTVGFPGSQIAGVGFDACVLQDVDLTGATDLQIGDPRTLVGAALCETQVPLIASRLAELLGIEVREC